MKMLQTILRWSYRVFWYSIVGLILIIAVALSLIRIFPPDVEVYRNQIEELASAVIERQVRIESMDARLSGFTPTVIFHDVHLLDKSGKNKIIHFERASLGLDFFRSIYNGKLIPKSFTIHGVRLGITRKRNGNFIIQGLDLAELESQLGSATEIKTTGSDELSEWLFKRSELAIKDSTIVWVDRIRGMKTRRFEHVNFFIRNDDERHQLSGSVRLPDELGRDLEVAFDFKGNILNPNDWSGQFYATGKGLQLVNWGIKPGFKRVALDAGVLDARLWGRWQQGRVDNVAADVSAYDMDIRFEKNRKPFYVTLARGMFQWQRKEHGWDLNVNNFRYMNGQKDWPATDITVTYSQQSETDSVLDAFTSFVRLEDVNELLLETGLLEKKIHDTLVSLKPAGELHNLYFGYHVQENQRSNYYLNSKFSDLGINSWEKIPGFSGVDGSIWLDQERGSLKLENSVANIDAPNLFRRPFEMTRLDGVIRWQQDRDNWHVTATNMDVATADLETDLSFMLSIPADSTSPFLDLQMQMRNGDVRQAWRYYPVSIMSKELIDWLDNGLVEGRMTEGGFVFNGRLADFPFRNNQGVMLAHFNLLGSTLNYYQGWPQINQMQAEVKITGLGLEAYAQDGMVYDSHLKNTHVTIRQFRNPVLAVNGQVQGSTDSAIRFLVQSPIAPDGNSFYQQSNINGSAAGRFKLILPLAERLKKTVSTHYEGYIKLRNSELDAWKGKLQVSDITGRIDFNPRGAFSEELKGKVFGGETEFNLFTQDVRGAKDIKLGMQGIMEPKKVTNHIVPGIANRVTGKADWQGVLSFGYKNKQQSVPGSFQFATNLKGVKLKLPLPFTKKEDEKIDVTAEVTFPEKELIPVKLKYGNKFSSNILFHTNSELNGILKKGAIRLLAGEPELPVDDRLVIRGGLLEFPVDEWGDILAADKSSRNKPMLDSLGAPLILDMDFLHIITREDENLPEPADPNKTALINGQIADFKVDDRHFGKFTIATSRHADGIRIDKLRVESEVMKVDIEGTWFKRDGQQRTNLVIIAMTDNLGSMLDKLGYSAVIHNGNAKAVMQAYWQDAPNRFELAKLNGSLAVIIDEGIIKDIKPGAGRMLGLLSVTELPRRLLFDFGELQEGLKFKQIYGNFEIEKGNATTNNLSIISPIAFVGITGRTGLATQDFDQHVSVVPNVSGTLPVISWLFGGGQIGAFTFILDQLFGGEVNKNVETEYHITGSWEKPVITKLKKNKQPDSQTDNQVQ